MRLWEFLLEEDKKFDLSSVKVSLAWASGFSSRIWAKQHDESEIDGWYADRLWSTLFGLKLIPPTDAEEADWSTNFFALRKCAARLYGVAVLETTIEDEVADGIFKYFVSLLSPRIVCDSILITSIDRVRYRPRDSSGGDDYSSPASRFWQMAFGSLAFDSFSGICRGCNKELGFTPKGKPRKGEYCKVCINKNAFKKLPKKEQQRINREKQARLRKRKKGGADGA